VAMLHSTEMHTSGGETVWANPLDAPGVDLAEFVARKAASGASLFAGLEFVASRSTSRAIRSGENVAYSWTPGAAFSTREAGFRASKEAWDHLERLGRHWQETVVRVRVRAASSTAADWVSTTGRGERGPRFHESSPERTEAFGEAVPRVRSALGERLRQIRAEYIASGGRLLTLEEIRREVTERRGEHQGEE
jgi:hypothetical protein